MKHVFQARSFKPETLHLIDQVNAVIDEYQSQGYTLTVRQAHYQFVSRGPISNTQRSYKRLGKVISNARLAGLIDWGAIVDRTRNVRSNPHWDGVDDVLAAAADSYRRDLWAGQSCAVEIWIEKEALIGVIEDSCIELDVPFFACRGYVSQSELWRAGQRVWDRWRKYRQKTVILHLGDHDPFGVDMTRDNQVRVELFADCGSIVIVKRIALNWDQIQEHQPPPNPAKLTDTRARDYIKQYGIHSWELDALEPRLIEQLIREAVTEHLDLAQMQAVKVQQESERQQLHTLAREI